MANEIVVGLDIGTTKISAIVGRKNQDNKIDILGLGKSHCEGVSRGVVTNIDKTVNAIQDAVNQASSKSDVAIKVANVGIAGQHIKSIQHRGLIVRNEGEEEISKADTDRLINDMYKLGVQQGEEIIHVIPQEYIVDSEHGIKDPIGMAGVRLEGDFHIITGQVTAAKNLYRCVKKAGIQVSDLILEPVASSDSVLMEEEKEEGTALIDIGGGTTDIAIFKEGIIRHTAVIPLGGAIITEDIKQGCSIMRKQAERLKTEFGCALADEVDENEIISIDNIKGRDPREISRKNLAYIVQARLEEIFEHVYHEIQRSGYEKALAGGIVLTGGGAQLSNMAELAEYITGLDTRIGYPTEYLSEGMIEEIKSPLYSTAAGLIMGELGSNNHPTTSPNKNEKESPKPKRWLDTVFEKGKRWFEDNQDIEDFK